MTYTEGWPKTIRAGEYPEMVDTPETEVVPLSDAERLREERDKEHAAGMEIAREHAEAVADAERLQEALEMLADSPKELPTWARHIARVTLDREGERISSWPSRKAFERDTARRNMRMGERGDYCPTCGSPDKAEGCPECGLPCDNEWHGEYRAGFEEARLRKALKRALDESHTYETLRGRVIAALGRKGEGRCSMGHAENTVCTDPSCPVHGDREGEGNNATFVTRNLDREGEDFNPNLRLEDEIGAWPGDQEGEDE
jgi:hypothetical protein